MHILSRILTCRGRLGRGPYLRLLAASLAVGGASIALVVVVGLVLSVLTLSRQAASGSIVVLVAGCLAAIGWCGLALTARRLRDIGLDPWLVLPAWIAFTQFDALVLSRWLRGGDPSFTAQTPFGAGMTVGFFVLLVLWPGRSALERSAISPRTAPSGSRPA